MGGEAVGVCGWGLGRCGLGLWVLGELVPPRLSCGSASLRASHHSTYSKYSHGEDSHTVNGAI